MDEQRLRIQEAVVEAFRRKGFKFTMDDLATEMHMSKKTIYKVYDDKAEMFEDMVDYVFDNIKESEAKILNDENMSTVDKISHVLIALPDTYDNIDFRMLYLLKDKYPTAYAKMNKRLENDWESTINLLEEGIKEGVIRDVSIPVLKIMFEATLEKFLSTDVLIKNKLTYKETLDSMISILMNGLKA